MAPRPPTQNLNPQRGFSEVCSRPQDKEEQTNLGDKGIDTGLKRHLMDTMDRQLIHAFSVWVPQKAKCSHSGYQACVLAVPAPAVNSDNQKVAFGVLQAA